MDDTLARWRHVVQEYSGLEPTKLEGGRLQALSGVASEFAKALRAKESPDQTIQPTGRMQIRYTCGLWFPDVATYCGSKPDQGLDAGSEVFRHVPGPQWRPEQAAKKEPTLSPACTHSGIST